MKLYAWLNINPLRAFLGKPQPRRRHKQSIRPRIEHLEDRTLPSSGLALDGKPSAKAAYDAAVAQAQAQYAAGTPD